MSRQLKRPLSQIRYGNRIIQQKQQTSTLQKHYQSLRKTRPLTGNTVQRNNTISINNKKKQMVQQNRFTQIQRQNRILFTKISTIMNKGGTILSSQNTNNDIRQYSNYNNNNTNYSFSNNRMNKTLNGGYRKKQLQNIQYENAKMLKRLKQKKSSYGVNSFNRDWQKKKKVIQNMSLYPFILNDNLGSDIRRSRINQSFLLKNHLLNQPNLVNQLNFGNNNNEQIRQIRRVRKINGYMFLVTVKFEDNKLFIIGDIRQEESIKIIELDIKQGMDFIIQQCNGNVQNIFGLLRFDRDSGDLYLVGRNVGQIEQIKYIQQYDRRRVVSQHDSRKNKNNNNIYNNKNSYNNYYSYNNNGFNNDNKSKQINHNEYNMNNNNNINNNNNGQRRLSIKNINITNKNKNRNNIDSNNLDINNNNHDKNKYTLDNIDNDDNKEYRQFNEQNKRISVSNRVKMNQNINLLQQNINKQIQNKIISHNYNNNNNNNTNNNNNNNYQNNNYQNNNIKYMNNDINNNNKQYKHNNTKQQNNNNNIKRKQSQWVKINKQQLHNYQQLGNKEQFHNNQQQGNKEQLHNYQQQHNQQYHQIKQLQYNNKQIISQQHHLILNCQQLHSNQFN